MISYFCISCWCLRRSICAACGSPATCLMWHAVALELSMRFASCHTLLAGNLSKSTLPLVIVLDTNSSSHRKNKKMSLCKTLNVAGVYFAGLTSACIALYHSSTLFLPFLKLVRRSKWALTSLDSGWQNSSNVPQIVSKVYSSAGKHHETYWFMPVSTLVNHFLAFLLLRQSCKLTFLDIFTFQTPL